MSKPICASCSKPKATLTCGSCKEDLCKSCAEFLENENFHYMSNKPEELTQSAFCNTCFGSKILPQLEEYDRLVEKAKNILVFSKTQGKETRLIKRVEDPVYIKEGTDEGDITMRLAFIAAQKNYNAIVDADIIPVKVRDGSYQTTHWSGSAVPVHLDESKLLKDRSFQTDPN